MLLAILAGIVLLFTAVLNASAETLKMWLLCALMVGTFLTMIVFCGTI